VSRFAKARPRHCAELSQGRDFYWTHLAYPVRAKRIRTPRGRPPDIWQAPRRPTRPRQGDLSPASIYAAELYGCTFPSTSIDYAIMERASDIAMVPARLSWTILALASLLRCVPQQPGQCHLVYCRRHRFRKLLAPSDGACCRARLRMSASVATVRRHFVPLRQPQRTSKTIVEQRKRAGGLENQFTPAADRVHRSGALRRARASLVFPETLPSLVDHCVDERHGRLPRARGFDAGAAVKPNAGARMRAGLSFASPRRAGLNGPADRP